MKKTLKNSLLALLINVNYGIGLEVFLSPSITHGEEGKEKGIEYKLVDVNTCKSTKNAKCIAYLSSFITFYDTCPQPIDGKITGCRKDGAVEAWEIVKYLIRNLEEPTTESEAVATSTYLDNLTNAVTDHDIKPYDTNGDGKISYSDDIIKDNMITQEDKTAYVKPKEIKNILPSKK